MPIPAAALAAPPLSRRQRRVLYTSLAAKIIDWVPVEGARRGEVWEIAMDEQYVAQKGPAGTGRPVNDSAGKRLHVTDAVHKATSRHYEGTAGDFLLYIAGKYISDGSHPAWKAIGAHWKTLHPLCAWGGDFPGDANHLSLWDPATGTA